MRVPQPHTGTPTMDIGLQMLLNSTLISAHLMISRLFQMSYIVEECKYILKQGFALINFLRYLMVDVVVNDVMATSTTPDLSKYMFKDKVNINF